MEEVKAYFGQFGRVEEAVLLMDNVTKRHRGFGFVTFDCEDTVDRVCEIHYHTVKNKKVECKKALPKEAVQAQTAALLSKRVSLLAGYNTAAAAAASQMAAAQAAQVAQFSQLAQVNAAATGYGKLMTPAYPSLASYRYSPYPLPAALPAATPTAAALTPAAATGNPYQSYALSNPVDMSAAFQNVDWTNMAGVYGMYAA